MWNPSSWSQQGIIELERKGVLRGWKNFLWENILWNNLRELGLGPWAKYKGDYCHIPILLQIKK